MTRLQGDQLEASPPRQPDACPSVRQSWKQAVQSRASDSPQAMEAILEVRYNLRMIGFIVDEPAWFFEDNLSEYQTP